MAWSILGDEDLLPERQWQPPPFRRGTNQILVECFATLLLCVWTAVHLNLQPKWRHDEKGLRKLTSKIPWKKCGYLVLGMIAPELVTVVAIYQWRETNKLWAEIQKTDLVDRTRLKEGRMKRIWRWITCSRRPASEQDEEIEMGSEERATRPTSPTVMSSQASPEAVAANLAQTDSASARHEEAENEGTSSIHTPDQHNGSTATPDGTTQQQSIPKEQPRRRRHYWTKTHCWYAYIGGFVIQDLHGEAFPLPNGLARMSLNTKAILHFAQTHPQAFPDISELSIQDKSKADALAKVIVCGQALWFCTNLLGRVIARLPLTALELNTSAHCICTLLTYIFWWKKPYNVSDATSLLLDDETASEAAYLCLHSWDGMNVVCEGADLRYIPRSLSWISSIAKYQYLKLLPADWGRDDLNFEVVDGETSQAHSHRQDRTGGVLSSFPAIFRGTIRWWFYSPFFFTTWLNDGSTDRTGSMRVPYAREHRQLITLAKKHIGGDHPCGTQHDLKAWRSVPELSWGMYVISDDGQLIIEDPVFFCMIFLACILYGGVHLLAVNGPFPSTLDRAGWYCGALAFVPFFLWIASMWSWVFLVEIIFLAFGSSQGFINRSSWDHWTQQITVWCIIVPGLVTPVLFILFRGFLTYEPYAALGFAPAGVYEVPRWSAYFIHIS